jgi:hypothetical protein
MRTPGLPVVDWTDAPADLNGLVRFAERRNLVSARVPSHFRRSLQLNMNWPKQNGQLVGEGYYSSIANCWSEISRDVSWDTWNIFAVFQYFYQFIPRFLVELVTLFCEPCWLGNTWLVHESYSEIQSFKSIHYVLIVLSVLTVRTLQFNFRDYTHTVAGTIAQSKTCSLVLVSIWRAAEFPLPPFPSRPGHEHNTVTDSLKMTLRVMCNDLTIKLWNAVSICLQLVKDTGISRRGHWHRIRRRLECVPGVVLMFFEMYVNTIVVVQDVMPCSLVDKCWRFGRTYCVNLLS